MSTFGYAGSILRVDLSSQSAVESSTLDHADRFLGGRGIAAKLYWDEVSPDVKAFDAENIEIPWPHTKVYFGNAPQNPKPDGH